MRVHWGTAFFWLILLGAAYAMFGLPGVCLAAILAFIGSRT